jgi:hypothetical protein
LESRFLAIILPTLFARYEAALMSALGSKEGQAASGDMANFASSGVTLMHYPVG